MSHDGAKVSAKELLLQHAARLRHKADNYEALANELGDISREADTALWQIILASK